MPKKINKNLCYLILLIPVIEPVLPLNEPSTLCNLERLSVMDLRFVTRLVSKVDDSLILNSSTWTSAMCHHLAFRGMMFLLWVFQLKVSLEDAEICKEGFMVASHFFIGHVLLGLNLLLRIRLIRIFDRCFTAIKAVVDAPQNGEAYISANIPRSFIGNLLLVLIGFLKRLQLCRIQLPEKVIRHMDC